MSSLLYIAFKDFSILHFGASAKVLSQCRALEQYGYTVDLIGRNKTDAVLMNTKGEQRVLRTGKTALNNKKLENVIAKQTQLKAVREYVKGKHFDACYIRYDFSDPNFIKTLKVIKKVCNKVFLELPTYPYEKENNIGLLNKVKMAIDLTCRKQLHKYVDHIITFYDGYTSLFGIPVLVIPNGFDFDTMSLVKEPLPEDALHIIAVSSMREWHGYERMIEGMHEYYQNNGKENIVLHLVGNGREYAKYKSLVDKYDLTDHIIMEGAMHGEKLDALYEKCALGVDSLARHRSGIDVLSSLKSREYGAKGLPIINSCKIDVLGDDFKYLLQVPADESSINIKDVIAFVNNCYCNKNRTEVGIEIRTYLENKTSMKATLEKVVRCYQK